MPMTAHLPVHVAEHDPCSSPLHSTIAVPVIDASHSAAHIAETLRSTVHEAGVTEMPREAPTGSVAMILSSSVATRVHAFVTASSPRAGVSSPAGTPRSGAIAVHAVSMSDSTAAEAVYRSADACKSASTFCAASPAPKSPTAPVWALKPSPQTPPVGSSPPGQPANKIRNGSAMRRSIASIIQLRARASRESAVSYLQASIAQRLHGVALRSRVPRMSVTEATAKWVEEQFAKTIVPTLVEYIKIPN